MKGWSSDFENLEKLGPLYKTENLVGRVFFQGKDQLLCLDYRLSLRKRHKVFSPVQGSEMQLRALILIGLG